MNGEIKVDKDYKDAFNLGYELAQELKLKSQMFQGKDYDNSHINVMNVWMTAFVEEVTSENTKSKGIDCLSSAWDHYLNLRLCDEITWLFLLVLLLANCVENTRHSYCYVCVFRLAGKQNNFL